MKNRLKSLLKKPVYLTITDNRRSIITARWIDNAYHIRLHHMFLEANDDILEALARYIQGRTKIASKKINIFIRENENKIRRLPPTSIKRNNNLLPQGKYFNLQEIYKELNRKYFDNQVNCRITWGNRRRFKRQKSVRLGSYSYHTKTIRIHPTLDRAFVPAYVVSDIVYHEMLHALLGIKSENGRNYSHHQRFRELEKRFSHRKAAEKWIRHNLNRLISARPKS
jgi:hypothetical protein